MKPCYQSGVRLAILFGLFVHSGLAASAIGQEKSEQKEKPKGPIIAMRTIYMQEPIGQAHRISIRGELGGKGQVVLDGNTCTLTQFGDPGVCTEIAFPPIEVKTTQVRLADPTGQGRRLFLLEGKLRPDDAKFFLVVPRRRSQPHRLIVDLSGDHRRAVTLESIPTAPATDGKPRLCSSAKYQAVQREGKVVLTGEGEHPTEGWLVAFEQLPIKIFPPQWRLVCLPPKLPAEKKAVPFKVSTSFKADQAVKEIIIHDDRGRHKVPVKH